MKIMVYLLVLANVVLFMWEFRYGAIDQGSKAEPQRGQQAIVLVSEVKTVAAVWKVDFTTLYPQGLDPLADNLLTEPFALEDFTGELLSAQR